MPVNPNTSFGGDALLLHQQALFNSYLHVFEPPLTCHVGELVLQGADVGHIDVEEGAELGHGHADPGDGDVGQATAAVH